MYLSELFEARRNPELNPKNNIIADLEPFHNDPMMFITFISDAGVTSHVARGKYARLKGQGRDPGNTPALARALKDPATKVRNGSGVKIGINPSPQSTSTPVGVYAYQLTEMWPELVNNTLPYGQTKPFVALLRSTGDILDLATYSEGQLENDIAKLKPIVARLTKGTGHAPEEFFDLWTRKSPLKIPHTPGFKIWQICRNIATLEAEARHGFDADGFPSAKSDVGAAAIWNALFRSLGYQAVNDSKRQSIIHVSEPCQCVFLSQTAFKVVTVLDNNHPAYRADYSQAAE